MKTRTWSALCLVLGGCAAPGASGQVESATRPRAAYYRDILRGLVGRECLLRSTESAILDFEARGFTLSMVGDDFVRLEHEYEGRRREVYLPIGSLRLVVPAP